MSSNNTPSGPPEALQGFLKSTLPFSELDDETIAWLTRKCVIDFQPKGRRIMVRGSTIMEHLLVIQRGGVRLFVGDETEDVLLDLKGVGESLGELSLINEGPTDFDAETVEDTFFVKMGKDAFLKVMKDHPCVAHYYLKTFSSNYLDKAFSEMGRRRSEVITDSGLYLFSTKVGEMVIREPVTGPMDYTIRQAAKHMTRERSDSLLVIEPSGDATGIVTDTNLRQAVAMGLDSESSVQTIMTTPVETIDSDEVCFDALMRMMTMNIHHLAVTQRGRIQSVVTSHDIKFLQGKSPLSIFREINSSLNYEGLYPLSGSIPSVVSTMVEEGAKAEHITRMVTVLNDLILHRLMQLLTKELGPAPTQFSWLLLGSEGRHEQTFSTDQDNALVLKDTDDDILQRASAIYFEAFTKRANEHLEKCGFPLCRGGVMASNPPWRRPLADWTRQVEGWVAVPEPEEVLKSTIFFDFRHGWGDERLTKELKRRVLKRSGSSQIFLRLLAADCMRNKPPLSFFKSFIVENDGEHRNQLDLKKRGLLPFVDFARTMALENGLEETSTLSRLRRLGEQEHIPSDLAKESAEAFEFVLHMRLTHQLELIERKLPPDNHIDPGRKSNIEKRTLKDAFGVIERIQGFLEEHFRLNI